MIFCSVFEKSGPAKPKIREFSEMGEFLYDFSTTKNILATLIANGLGHPQLKKIVASPARVCARDSQARGDIEFLIGNGIP